MFKILPTKKVSIIPLKTIDTRKKPEEKTKNNDTLSFVHIGKTGGTSIRSMCSQANVKLKSYHCEKIPWNPSEKYIIWIRNPIKRFVSAFYFIYYSILQDTSKYSLSDVENAHKFYSTGNPLYKTNSDLDDELCLDHILRKIKNKNQFLISTKIDNDFKFFNTPNKLAESLYSNNVVLKQKAIDIMYTHTHLKMSIGYYLNNGNFVGNRNNQILFVGRQEAFCEDAAKLEKVLNVKFKGIHKKRENTHFEDKYMSELAIKNIINWYADDYLALKELRNYGWITQEILDSYYKY
jgi:hypothetical protein